MAHKNRFDIPKTIPKAYQALGEVEGLLKAGPIDPLLRHLVKLRISQINGCAYCVKLHSKEARADNETEDRLEQLVVWRNVDVYTAAEKAAFAWAEALTTRGDAPSLDPLHHALEEHFNSDEIAHLSLIIVMINSWNRIQVATDYEAF